MRRLADKRRLVIFFVTGLLIVLAGAVAHAALVHQEFDRAVAEAKSLGLPTTNNDPRPPVPDDQNAALTPGFDLKKNQPPTRPSRRDSTPKELKTYLTSGANGAALIQKSIDLPYYRASSQKWLQGQSHDEFPFLKGWAAYFQMGAIESGKKHDFASAERDLKTVAKLADFAGQSSDELGALVQIALNSITRAGFLQVVKDNNNSSASLRLAQSVESALHTPDFNAVLQTEAAHALIAAKYLCDHPDFIKKQNQAESQLPDLVDNSLPNSTPADLTALNARVLRQFAKLARIYQSNESNPAKAFTKLNMDPGIPKPEGSLVLGEDLYAWAIAQAPLADGLSSMLDDQTKHRLTRIGLEILAYKNLNGFFPKTLDTFATNQSLIDPWSGKQFLYRTEKKWFVVYSVGQNQTDDGGYAVVPKPDAPTNLPPGFGTPPTKSVSTPSDDILFQTADSSLPCLVRGRK